MCPNGIAFVRQHIQKGVLPTMVEEILRTRLMVKRSMKDYKGDKVSVHTVTFDLWPRLDISYRLSLTLA